MEEDINFNEDDSFYHTDFEDDLEYILGVENLLHRSFESHLSTSSTTMKDDYFHLSDFESSSNSDEDMEDMWKEDGEWESNFENVDSPHLVHEFSKPSFDHGPIESSSKFIQFNLASRDLMILCLKSRTLIFLLSLRFVKRTRIFVHFLKIMEDLWMSMILSTLKYDG